MLASSALGVTSADELVDGVFQVRARADLARPAHQRGQQLALAAGQGRAVVLGRDEAGLLIIHQPANTDRFHVKPVWPAQNSAAARDHLAELERLHKIVIGAIVEAGRCDR